MSNPKPLTDQSGRPVGMVVTPEGARIEVLGDPLPPSQRGASIHVDPKGGGRPHGDFPVKHPNSGPTAKQKPPAPKFITPIDNNTIGRVYTMGLPPPQQTDAEPTEPPPPGYLERSGEVLKGYGEGLVELPIEAVKMAAEGWKNIVTEPVDTGKALLWGAGELGELGGMALDGWRQIVSDPGQAFDAFVWAAKEGLAQANEILGGDSRDAGKLVGEAVSVVLPTGVAKAKAKPKPKPAPTSGAAILRKKPPPDGYKTYKTQGVMDDPLASPEGRRLVKHLESQGLDPEAAARRANELMKTGTDLPLANPVEIGDRLYKVVPEGSMPGAKSEYWATRDQIGALEGMSRDQIANRLGLPLESQQAARFDVVEIKAMRPSMTFDSKIAPTTQNGWSQTGGGIQSLVTDRGAFTPPVKTGIKLP
jgi:hypothetical protein